MKRFLVLTAALLLPLPQALGAGNCSPARQGLHQSGPQLSQWAIHGANNVKVTEEGVYMASNEGLLLLDKTTGAVLRRLVLQDTYPELWPGSSIQETVDGLLIDSESVYVSTTISTYGDDHAHDGGYILQLDRADLLAGKKPALRLHSFRPTPAASSGGVPIYDMVIKNGTIYVATDDKVIIADLATDRVKTAVDLYARTGAGFHTEVTGLTLDGNTLYISYAAGSGGLFKYDISANSIFPFVLPSFTTPNYLVRTLPETPTEIRVAGQWLFVLEGGGSFTGAIVAFDKGSGKLAGLLLAPGPFDIGSDGRIFSSQSGTFYSLPSDAELAALENRSSETCPK